MDLQDRRGIRARAGQALAANPGDPRLTVLVYVLITAGSSLLVSILSTVLGQRIAQTGGLAALGLRTMLSAIRTALPLAQMVVLLGVRLGYQQAALDMARRRAVAPRTLLTGFSRFAPLLRAMLLQGLLYFLLALAAIYAASFIFMLTPLSADFYALVEPMLTDPESFYEMLYNDTAFYWQAWGTLVPMIPIFLVLFLAVSAPFYYQYRLTNFVILDEPRKGALAAMRESTWMMRGNRLAMLKLDLGFWWLWLGQAAASVVLYGDKLLPLIGVAMPWSATVNYYVCFVASLVLEGALYVLCLNRVETTYATVYEDLRPKPQPHQGGVVLGNIFDLAKDYREN